MIINEGEVRVNYRFIEIESKESNCFNNIKLVSDIFSKLFQKKREYIYIQNNIINYNIIILIYCFVYDRLL